MDKDAAATPTPASLETRKLEIEADPDFSNQFKNPAKNALLVKEWNETFSKLNPEPGQAEAAAQTETPPAEATTWRTDFAERATRGGVPEADVAVLTGIHAHLTGPDFGMPHAEFASWVRYAAETIAAGTPPDAEETEKHLRSVWGAEYDTNLARAQAAAKRLPQAFRDWLNETGLGDDANLIARLAALGGGA